MKCIKNILSLILTVCLVFSIAAVPVFAGESLYEIKGDCNIFLPKSGAIKLTYQLQTKAEGTAVTDAIYALSGDADLAKYAKIDSADGVGTLYVSVNAAGKSFTITAESKADANVNASLVVNVCATKYNTDFDDETGATVSNEIFSTKTAAVVTNGDGKAAEGATTSAATPSAYNLIITPTDFAVQEFTVEGKFLAVAGSQNYLSIAYGEDFNAYFGLEGTLTDGAKPYASIIKSSDYGYNRRQTAADKIPTYSATTYMPFKVVVRNNKSAVVTLDGIEGLWPSLRSDGEVAGTAVTAFAFGTLVDDIEIYSGYKAAATFETGLEILGDEIIARPPEGVTANHEYTLTASVSGTDVPADSVWSLASAYAGVSVSGTGVSAIVSVAGSAAAGIFNIQAKKDGEVLAEKSVSISGKVSNWMDKYDRYYNNLETQTVGSVLQYRMIGTSTWTDYALDAQNKTSYNHDSQEAADKAGEEWIPYNTMIKEDSTGNKYALATGFLHWVKNGATARIVANASEQPAVLDNAKKATFEGKFMIDSEILERMGLGSWNILGYSNNSGTTLDLRYAKATDGFGKILINMENGVGAQAPRTLAYVEIDKWFNVRLEFDNSDDTFDLYIDDVLVLQNEKSGLTSLHSSLITGCAFDDISFYTGTKAVQTKTAGDKLTVMKDGIALSGNELSFTWSEATEEDSTSKATAVLMSDVDYSGKGLLVAIYDNEKTLLAVNKADVIKTDAGLSLAIAGASAKVPQNAEAKIFIWDVLGVAPVK